MSTLNDFWKVIDAQLSELKKATSAADVLRILANERDPYGNGGGGSDGFFGGSGGDETVYDALHTAGWGFVKGDSIYYVMRAPNGDEITYCEGDIYIGDRIGEDNRNA